MKLAEKLLNDYLFATSRYLDKDGHPVDAGALQKFVSKPDSKIGLLSGVAISFAVAAAGAPSLVTNTLYNSISYLAFRFIYPIKPYAGLKNVPDYYFDTAPDRPMPIPGSQILTDLLVKRHSLKMALLSSASASAISLPILFAIGTAIGQDPVSNIQTSSIIVGIGAAMNFTNRIATAWRADQALKGNWNVLTVKPKPETSSERSMAPALQAL